jgi:hypothetical protein
VPTPSGYADVSLELTNVALTRPSFITFGVDPSSIFPDAIANSVLTAVIAAGSLLAAIDSNVTLTAVRVSAGTASGEDLVYELPTTNVGGFASTSLPPNCAVLVHKVTARGGRRGRGRMFLPWAASETAVDEAGKIGSADVTVIQGRMNTFLTALTTNSVAMVLLHRDSGPEVSPPTAPGDPDSVLSLRVDPLISTQRRRLGR